MQLPQKYSIRTSCFIGLVLLLSIGQSEAQPKLSTQLGQNIKSASIRTETILDTFLGNTSNVTYKDVSEKADRSIMYIDELIIAIKSNETSSSKGRDRAITAYLTNSQEIIRSIIQDVQSELDFDRSIKLLNRNKTLFREIGYGAGFDYALKAVNESQAEVQRDQGRIDMAMENILAKAKELVDQERQLTKLVPIANLTDPERLAKTVIKSRMYIDAKMTRLDTSQEPVLVTDSPVEKVALIKNCFACHTFKSRLIGPAFVNVSYRYRIGRSTDTTEKLAEKIQRGGSGAWGTLPMPANSVTTEEAISLADWILSLN